MVPAAEAPAVAAAMGALVARAAAAVVAVVVSRMILAAILPVAVVGTSRPREAAASRKLRKNKEEKKIKSNEVKSQ